MNPFLFDQKCKCGFVETWAGDDRAEPKNIWRRGICGNCGCRVELKYPPVDERRPAYDQAI